MFRLCLHCSIHPDKLPVKVDVGMLDGEAVRGINKHHHTSHTKKTRHKKKKKKHHEKQHSQHHEEHEGGAARSHS
jgi:hypothetical protein